MVVKGSRFLSFYGKMFFPPYLVQSVHNERIITLFFPIISYYNMRFPKGREKNRHLTINQRTPDFNRIVRHAVQ